MLYSADWTPGVSMSYSIWIKNKHRPPLKRSLSFGLGFSPNLFFNQIEVHCTLKYSSNSSFKKRHRCHWRLENRWYKYDYTMSSHQLCNEHYSLSWKQRVQVPTGTSQGGKEKHFC